MSICVPDFSRLRVLVAGDVMLDEYWFGDTGRISPEAPVPVVKTRSTEQRAGGAANVALNLAALGASASVAGIVGHDERGRHLSALLECAGVACRFVESRRLPTVHKLRVLARSQQLIRLDSEEPLHAETAAFGKRFAEAVEGADVVVLSDYGKGTLNDVAKLIDTCRHRGVAVLVDPKGEDFERYRGASLMTPNQREFAAVAGPWTTEDEFRAKGETLRANLDLDALLVTRGEHGMAWFSRDEPPIALDAQAREVFDVTGAGDTVIALMAVAIGAGLSGEQAVRLANLGAGLVVGKIGVATVTRAELRLALHRQGSGGDGLVDGSELMELLVEARARGERIVMTNGCFDILHAGHVSYLEEAKSLGDRLVVAVNDDASVARLKGPTRPVTPLEDRLAVLAGLAAVDWVVPFSEDTPAALIERLLPDVLVKGDDYAIRGIAGADAVLRNGGTVQTLSLKPGRSTTQLIETIRSIHDV